jgi:hypothetical protein
MMIGNGTPSSQSSAPRPKPMMSSPPGFCVGTTHTEGQSSSRAAALHAVFLPEIEGTNAGRHSFCSDSQKDRTMVCKQGDQIIESAREARQAERGPTARNVLVASTSLLIAAFIILWFIFFRT